MELADVTDSKSVGSDTVWVRVPPPAPEKNPHLSTTSVGSFQLSVPYGTISTPSVREAPIGVSGTLNFTLCVRTILHSGIAAASLGRSPSFTNY